MASIQYRPEVDGLRAIAVIPVILFHLGLEQVAGGYLGVDVFFVISGYLITSIILREVSTNSFTFTNFWTRRIRRILPALLTTVILTQLCAALIIFRPDLYDISFDAFAGIFSYANIHMWLKLGDYWGAAAESSPYLHTWSLSVEEQFYFFYPLLLIAAYKLKFDKILLLGLILVGSLAMFWYGITHHPNAAFFLLPTRAWELACGGLVAVLHHKQLTIAGNWARAWLPQLGIALIAFAYIAGNGSASLAYAPVFAVTGAGLIVYATAQSGWVYGLLASRPLVYIGKLSYSAYLVHWPVIVLLKEGFKLHQSPLLFIASAAIATVALTLALYYCVERPTRRTTAIFPIVGVLYAAVITVSLYLILFHSQRPYSHRFEPVEFYGLYYDASPSVATPSRAKMLKRRGVVAPEQPSQFAKLHATTGITGSVQGLAQIVVIGDSHGSMWAKTLDEIATELGKPIGFFTLTGNYPLFEWPLQAVEVGPRAFTEEQWRRYREAVATSVTQPSTELVVVALRWSSKGGEVYRHIEQLVKLASTSGKQILLVEQPPEIEIGDRNSAEYLAFAAQNRLLPIKLQNVEMVRDTNLQIRRIAALYSGAESIDLNNLYMLGHDLPRVEVDGAILYYDDDHLSYQGTSLAKATLGAKIASMTEVQHRASMDWTNKSSRSDQN
jgi:peptidoglycan/LPS O-acetylase OafA/YrhL